MNWTIGVSGSAAAVATAAAAALLALCVVLERRRRSTPLGWRIAATVLAVSSLLLLFLRPARWVEAGPVSAAALWTAGATAGDVETGDGEPRFVMAGVPAPGPDWRPIPDLGFLARRHPEVERLRVAGHGLRAWDWEAFRGPVELAGEPAFAPGPRQVSWPRRVALGDELIVRGVVASVRGVETTLRLEGPGGTEDSLRLSGEEERFELRARPRDAGRVVYRWILETAEDSLPLEGTIDAVVVDPAGVTVLWLEDAPGFETRHFKSWLVERGGAAAIRSRISRDRFRTELHGLDRLDISRLRAAVLERFDLVVLDPATLRSLRRSEAEALRAAVTESGLGVLLLPGRQKIDIEGWWRFAVEPVADLEEITAAAAWPDAAPTTPLVIAAREIEAGGGIDPLVWDDSGRVLAACRVDGAGAVGLTLLHDSYRWVLEGNAEHHGRYWSRLIRAMAKRDTSPVRWLLPVGPILVDEPLELELETDVDDPVVVLAPEGGAEERPPVRRDLLEPRRWHVAFWPRETGWHRLGVDGVGGEDWFYVDGGESWTAWQEQWRQTATLHRVILGEAPGDGRAERPKRREELPRGWFFGAFLAAVFFLWVLERRQFFRGSRVG